MFFLPGIFLKYMEKILENIRNTKLKNTKLHK